MREDIPDPAWRAPARAAHTPLTRDAIVEAAVRVLDRDGLDGLSMRRVAEELGAGVASLYWHVRNKEALLGLVAERLTAEIDLPAPDPSRWREQLALLAGEMRAIFHRHRDSARITLGRVPVGPDLVRVNEWLFTLLKPAGIPDRVIAYFGDLASLYVGAYTFEESLGLASPTGEDMAPDRILAMFREYLLSLPADRFPNVHRAVEDIVGGDADDRFAFGLEVILRGIATYADDGPRHADPLRHADLPPSVAQAATVVNKRNGRARREPQGS